MTGCFSTPAKLKLDAKIGAVTAKLEEEKKELTKAVNDALVLVPTNSIVSSNVQATAALTLAKTISEQNVNIHGLPIEPLDVNAILAKDNQEWKELLEKFKKERELIKQKASLEEQRNTYIDDLVDKGQKYEEEQKKNWLSRLWQWSLGTLGIGGMILLVVLCPAALPLVGSLVSFVIGKVPQLASLFGVVGKSVVQNVSTGIESFKQKVAAEPIEAQVLSNVPETKVFTKGEVQTLLETHSDNVLTLLKTELSTSMDSKDKVLIKHMVK